MKHLLHYDGGNRVDDKLVAIVLCFQITVRSTRPDKFSVLHGLPLLRPDLAPNIQSIGFIYHVAQRNDDTGMGILRGGGVVVLIDRDKADVSDTKILLNIIAGVDGVPPQTGKVFNNYAVYMTGFNIGEHLLEAGTVEVRSRSSVVDVGIVNSDLRVLFQKPGDNQLLCFNGCAAGMGIFYRKTDIDSSAASVIDFRCDNGNRFFSAFSCHT